MDQDSDIPLPQTLAELEELLKEMEAVERNSGYVFCSICGKYDEDAGGIDYWVWKGKKWCYGGCWVKKVNEVKEKIELLKKSA